MSTASRPPRLHYAWVIAGVTFLVLLVTAGIHPPQGSPAPGHPAQAGRPASSATAGHAARSAVSVRTVGVSTSLLGRPASAVRRELRGLGLVVRVQQQPDAQAAPGSVVRIYPTGQVRVGSVVQLTAATRPAPSAPASTHPVSTPPASGTPAPSAGPTATSTTSSSPGRAKHSKGPPPGHG